MDTFTSAQGSNGIPLVSIPSSTSTYTYSTVNEDGDGFTTTAFVPSTELQIQATGKPCLSFPHPPKQLEIHIFSPLTGRPVYLSIRPTRQSGSCRLVRAEDDLEAAIARTTYRFGPGRNPVVRIGGDDELDAEAFEMVGKGILTRAVGFETRRWGRFEWRYSSKSERAQFGADNLLILEKIIGGEGMGERRLRVAQLVRGDGMRTAGTRASSAGNGGRLQMDLMGEKGHGEVDEVVVVATCLAMLKKEIDRSRAMQLMLMPGAASGFVLVNRA